MSENLTTQQIIHYIEKDIVPADWAWECAITSAMGESSEDAIDGARFLEYLEPGRTWSAAEYYGLMRNHFTGRWQSAAHIGLLRADEELQDIKEKYEADDPRVEAAIQRFSERSASDEASAEWIRNTEHVGTYVFDSADGSVLTFDRIFGGIIENED